jgi:site-specific recombinase XerD
LKRFLPVLRDMIAPAEPPRMTPQDQIFAEFSGCLQRERGLAVRSIIGRSPTIRRFLREVCPAGATDFSKISQADVMSFVERHARDGSPASARVMCSSLRAFLRYLHHKGLSRVTLAGCVPSIRDWKFANLPTYLSAEQVQKVLDGCDRASAIGQRDYATHDAVQARPGGGRGRNPNTG